MPFSLPSLSSLLKLPNNTEHGYVSTEVHLSLVAYKRTEMPQHKNSDLRVSFSRKLNIHRIVVTVAVSAIVPFEQIFKFCFEHSVVSEKKK